MNEKTLIQVSKKTASRLKELKIAKHETYNEIINRIINEKISYEEKYDTLKSKVSHY